MNNLTGKEKMNIIESVMIGVLKNRKLKNKGFTQEEVDGMTEDELKEYEIE